VLVTTARSPPEATETGLELLERAHEDPLLVLVDGHRVQLQAVVLAEESRDLLRGHAAQRVEVVLVQVPLEPHLHQRGLPGEVMERHRVHEGAVQVEDVAAKVALRDL
jgi:predicted kinase